MKSSTIYRRITSLASRITKSIFIQLVAFSIIILGTGVAYAAWTTLSSSQWATGLVIDQTLMQGIINNLNDLNGRVNVSTGAPAGLVSAFNLATCPTGWIPANGTSGTPDLRGEFIRGLDSGRWVDGGRVLGSSQADDLKSHSHTIPANIATFPGPTNIFMNGDGTGGGSTLGTSPSPTSSFGWLETRPRNIALLYCVKN